jgi:hypothetical protein
LTTGDGSNSTSAADANSSSLSGTFFAAHFFQADETGNPYFRQSDLNPIGSRKE